MSRALTGEVGLSSARAAKKLKRRKRTNRLKFKVCSFGNLHDQDSDGCEHDLLLLLGALERLQHCRSVCQWQGGDQSSCENLSSKF